MADQTIDAIQLSTRSKVIPHRLFTTRSLIKAASRLNVAITMATASVAAMRRL